MKLRKGLSVLLTALLLLGGGSVSSFAQDSQGAASSNRTSVTGHTDTGDKDPSSHQTGEQDKPSSSSAVFSDISGHWAESTIEQAVKKKMVGGYPDGTFRPDNPIKREEFFSLFSNLLTEKPDTSKTVIRFTDVVPSEWYVPAIKTAVAEGMTSGYPDGTFGIGRTMTREEAAQVVASAIPDNVSPGAEGIDSLKDHSQVSDWAYKAVDLMVKKGYMKGDTDGNFRPGASLTRAEATQILLQTTENEPIIGGDAQKESDHQKLIDSLKDGCAEDHLPKNAAGEYDFSPEALAKLPEGIFKKGKGTESNPYQVSTQEQLNHIRAHNKPGTYFKLTADIDVTKDYATKVPAAADKLPDWTRGNWEPLGSKDTPFVGHIDGDGHKITGLNISDEGQTADPNKNQVTDQKAPITGPAGFVGWLGAEGSIANLTIDDSSVENAGPYAGAVAGYALGSVTGCTAGKGTLIIGADNNGGIAGYSEGVLQDNENKGKVTGQGKNTGGVAGKVLIKSSQNILTQCRNSGQVNGSDSIGGVVGAISTDPSFDGGEVMKDCQNSGTVKGSHDKTGGVAGTADGTSIAVTIEGCNNKGSVTSEGVSGGILGGADGRKVTVSGCENTGNVEGKSAGGIVGSNEGLVRISKNSGSVKGSIFVGGITGYQNAEDAKLLQCINTGRVSGEDGSSNIGGIVGENDSTVLNCYNTGRISGGTGIGGIAGSNTKLVGNTYSTGKVDGSNNANAIAGKNTGMVENSFWLEGTAEGGADGQYNTTQKRVYSVTEDMLKGNKEVLTDQGRENILDALNKYNGRGLESMWRYNGGFPQLSDFPFSQD